MKKLCVLSFIVSVFFAVSLPAQDQATIVGAVTDPSGAAVPGANLTVENPAKGFVLTVATDSAGEYTAARIPIGNYVISVEAPGFQRLQRTGVALTVGQVLRVDMQLALGSANQRVTVQGNIPKVETETAAISDVVTGKQIQDLNLNGRNYTNLVLLVPGVAPGNSYDPTTVGLIEVPSMSVNGLPWNENNWEIDGITNVDQGDGANSLELYPSVDAIEEFRVSTSNYSAEYSKSAGGMIELVTKSGTSSFHGDLFEFVRNDKLDANDWFLNRQIAPPGGNAPKTPLKRNDFGFTFGGPFYIPGHYNTSKTKTFFFVSEEWRRNRQGTILNSQVPTLRMRQGDFSECDPKSANFNAVAASGCQLPVNPATGQGFAGDLVPIDHNAADLLNALVPLPNNGIDGYTAAPSLATNFREDLVRVDQNVSDRTRIFVRYAEDAYLQEFMPSLWSGSSFGTAKTIWQSPVKSGVLHFTRTFKPTLMNEFIAGLSADQNPIHDVNGIGSPAGTINKTSDFSAKNIFPANGSVVPFLPGITVCGGDPFCMTQSTGFVFSWWAPQPILKDNLIWTSGKTTWKFGFSLMKIQADTSTNIGLFTQGYLNFSNSASVSTGNALADMYLGRIASYSEYGRVINGQPVGGIGYGHWRGWDFEPYVQNDWKIRPNLTLNLGLRYYYLTPFNDALNRPTLDSIFIPSLYNPAAQAQLDATGNLIPSSGATYLNFGNGLVECGTGSVPVGCFSSYRKTLSPRFGFAWDPKGNGKTSVRGGYALTYDSGNPLEAGAGFNGNPPGATTMSAYNIVGYGNIGPGPIAPASFSNVPRYQKWPSVQQFSLGVEHTFGSNDLLGVSYVGTLGHHLANRYNMNQVPVGATTENVPALAGTTGCDATGNCNVQQILINNLQQSTFFVPYRGYSAITLREYTANSNYNSLQVNFRHTTAYGLTFQAAYTWAHTLDSVIDPGINDYDQRRWYGTSNLNQTHVMVLNYIYDLPVFRHSSNSLLRGALGGWQVSGITTFSTGNPLDFNCGIAGLSSGVGGAVRCNTLGPLRVKKGVVDDPSFGPTPTWFDPSVVGQVTLNQLAANNEPGMFGYMGKNMLTEPGRNNWDLALLKNFPAPWFNGEHSTIQFRWETFNSFNHPQWQYVAASCNGLTLPGQPCNGSNNIGNAEINSAFPPRIMQFGLKFIF